MGQIHYNDIGTALRATIKDENGVVVDISEATSLIMKMQRPNGVVVLKESSLTGDGSDGIMEYVTEDGDLDAIGTWTIQGYVVLPTGSWHSDLHEFKVHRNLS